jgi:1,4-dihydroxy-2-naphthoyl-CoA hydrolase
MIDTSVPLDILNNSGKGTLNEHLAIEFIEINENYIKSRMPVDHRTRQQIGMLNGGASAALAETTASVASYLSVERSEYICLGLELKINHLKPARSGYVFATASPIHIGFQTHVWQVKIEDESGEQIAFSTLTLSILPVAGLNNPDIKAFISKYNIK